MKPKLLIVELWGLGDLVIATPFIRAATERFEVTVLAKPYAQELRQRFWRDAKVFPFNAPWTAFNVSDKYRLWAWPWADFYRLGKMLNGRFEVGLSARWGDPRDHFLLALTRAKRRLGYPRMGSQIFLTDPMPRPAPISHRYEYWRSLGQKLGLILPPFGNVFAGPKRSGVQVLIHSGAGQPVRVWPLDRYRALAEHLRKNGHAVQVVCDADQRHWWEQAGETDLASPKTVSELIESMDRAGVFIGNDSGPGHLAALLGLPTFTLFGPQLHEWFLPMHPAAEALEGKPCPYKPCSDYCRFPKPLCLHDVTLEEVLPRVDGFLTRNLPRE